MMRQTVFRRRFFAHPARLFSGGSSGVTLAETLVALSIIAVLAGIVVGNYRVSSRNDALGRSAHAVSVAVREAQSMALSAATINGAVPQGGYGVFFEKAGSSRYVIFADQDADRFYDGDSEKIEERALEPHIVFAEFAGEDDQVEQGPIVALFCSPYAATLLYDHMQSLPEPECIGDQLGLQRSLRITLGIDDNREVPGHIFRHVRIFASGAIEVLSDKELAEAFSPPIVPPITPPTPLSCSPSTATPQIDEKVTFTADGGTTGTWIWSAPGGSQPTGSGKTFHTQWPTAGAKTVTVERSGKSASCSVTVQPGAPSEPNLISQDLQRSVTAPAEFQSVTFTGNIANMGNANAPASSARFCIDNANCLTSTTGRIGNDHNVPALNAGAPPSTLTSASWTATAGNHTVYLCADVGTAVSESNEADNCTSQAFSVAGLPDLATAGNVNLSRTTVPRGSSLRATGQIQNSGSAAAEQSTAYFCWDNPSCGERFGTANVGALAPNQSQSVSTEERVNVSTGKHRIYLCADGPKAIDEGPNEGNNCGAWGEISVTN